VADGPNTYQTKKDKLAVFISYPNEDNLTAEALQNALVALDRDRIMVFKDSTSIPMGGVIGEYILDGLDRSDWFLAIGTDVVRQNFSWCGVELGVFTQSKRLTTHSNTYPIICIYDHSVPELFKTRKQTQVVALKDQHIPDLSETVTPTQKSPIYELMSEFAQYYRDFYDIKPTMPMLEAHDEWAISSSEIITDNYWQSIQNRVKNTWHPPKRLQISVVDGEFYHSDLKRIPKDSEIELSVPAYMIFDLSSPNPAIRNRMKWWEFENKIHNKTGALAITEMINDIIVDVLPDAAEARNDHTFVAPNGTRYRIILEEHLVYGNGRRHFTIEFLETLKRNYGGDEETTILTAGILLASKYRFLFLETGSRYAPEVLDRKDPEDLILAVKQMVKDVRQVHAEAADEGLADEKSLRKVLGDTEEVSDLFKKYWAAVADLESGTTEFLKSPTGESWSVLRPILNEFTRVIRPLNIRFLSLALNEYMNAISKDTNDGADTNL
jgi:hypothetical protein